MVAGAELVSCQADTVSRTPFSFLFLPALTLYYSYSLDVEGIFASSFTCATWGSYGRMHSGRYSAHLGLFMRLGQLFLEKLILYTMYPMYSCFNR